MKYFINASNWVKEEEIDMFYFSSFDESWKVHHEGDVGQRWGLWDKEDKLKFQKITKTFRKIKSVCFIFMQKIHKILKRSLKMIKKYFL